MRLASEQRGELRRQGTCWSAAFPNAPQKPSINKGQQDNQKEAQGLIIAGSASRNRMSACFSSRCPSGRCLSSRFRYGDALTPQKLFWSWSDLHKTGCLPEADFECALLLMPPDFHYAYVF
ncbi:hypothetical protein DUNSADRAFT_5233 [Dunaliella salina]|uniref:Encoded protein n=1 Tax=Dunaliella salina TaxID=3046 RepID=A0ABQ7GQM3_DUNSA|nr:hypothetical protein DUNSADRAFT_5233 [Dunaliella salina]|eukprot:KAF5836902.1 hypothetical protein DUNSADRAFT_5233 [Dunaliella salina]